MGGVRRRAARRRRARPTQPKKFMGYKYSQKFTFVNAAGRCLHRLGECIPLSTRGLGDKVWRQISSTSSGPLSIAP